MNSNLAFSLAIYQENYEAMKLLLNRLVWDLEKYAAKEDSNEGYIERKNEEIQTIAAFLNISEFVVNEILDTYIPPEVLAENENKFIGYIIKIVKAGGCESVFEQYKVLKAIL